VPLMTSHKSDEAKAPTQTWRRESERCAWAGERFQKSAHNRRNTTLYKPCLQRNSNRRTLPLPFNEEWQSRPASRDSARTSMGTCHIKTPGYPFSVDQIRSMFNSHATPAAVKAWKLNRRCCSTPGTSGPDANRRKKKG